MFCAKMFVLLKSTKTLGTGEMFCPYYEDGEKWIPSLYVCVCVWFSLSPISPSMIFCPSVRQLQRKALVHFKSTFHNFLSVCQLQRYQEMTEFYDVIFLVPVILNAPNKIFGPKLAHSSSFFINLFREPTFI